MNLLGKWGQSGIEPVFFYLCETAHCIWAVFAFLFV